MTLTHNGVYPEGWHIYIDYNGDGDWNDTDELAITLPTSRNAQTTTLDIPISAELGSFRMRIYMWYYQGPSNPCIATTYGEIEDYTLVVSADNTASSSANDVSYTYDAAGNRTARTSTLSVEAMPQEEGIAESRSHEIPAEIIDQNVITPLDKFDLYPNPVHTYLNVAGTIGSEVDLYLYTIDGRLAMSQKHNDQSRVNFSQLENGTYIVQIVTPDGKQKTWKVVKQ